MRFVVLLSILSLAVWPGWVRGQAPEKEDFPPGKGREVWEASCTSCHDTEEVVKLKGKLTADGWRSVVKTMTDYGAQVDPKDVGILVEYLNNNFGKKP